MKLPSTAKKLGEWADEIVGRCSASLGERAERGIRLKNLYLSGSEGGEPQTYPKTFRHIETLSSNLYSPIDLRFKIEHYGPVDGAMRGMLRTAGTELYRQVRRNEMDTTIKSAVTWGLVKGATIVKQLWTSAGIEATLIQPELMGVLREDIASLDKQEAFYHRTYMTADRFSQVLGKHPDREDLLRKARSYLLPGRPKGVEFDNQLKQIVLGGLSPYRASGQAATNPSRGEVDWLTNPAPRLTPQLLSSLIPFNELWVWDTDRGDEGEWTTIQFVGPDCVVEGALRHRNIFADSYDPRNFQTNLAPDADNPLSGHHPFTLISPNLLDGYIWGRSEFCNVGVLQQQLNTRIDGINKILRVQEDPPRFMKGMSGISANAYAKLKKPGGYLTEQNPNADVKTLAPELPATIYESVHELERMFDVMGGSTPITQGQGVAGIRSEGHADIALQASSSSFRDRALTVERQVENVGGVALALCQAHIPHKFTAWVPAADAGPFAEIAKNDETQLLDIPPVQGMVPVPFLLAQLPDDTKVTVDSHSSSPILARESENKSFALFRDGAMSPEALVARVHPAGEDELIQDLDRAKAEKAAFLQQHPEAAEAEASGKKKKK